MSVINRWKLGPTASFGAGMTEDSDGLEIHDALESVYTNDRGQYGKVLVYSGEEETFQNQTQNQDVDGNPDYVNNYLTSSYFTMKITIENEVVYVVTSDAKKNPTSFTTKCHPIIKNYTNQRCWVADANNKPDYTKKVNLTFTDLPSAFDRLGNLATNEVSISVTDISGNIVELSLGQKIIFTYTFFSHTDELRDEDSSTFWSTQDGDIDDYIIFDLNPFGANSTIVYNNIELVVRDLPFATGPYEYILQGASVLANTRQRYKHISSGYIPSKSEAGSFIIKFDSVDYRYLKLILIGTSNEDYNILETEIRSSIAEMESTVTTTTNMDLSTNCSGNLRMDNNDAYDINLSDYSLSNLADLDYSEGMGLLNMIYHKEYLNDRYSGYVYGITSGDLSPTTGLIDFTHTGLFNMGTSGSSVGIDFGSPISGDCLIIRDKYITNSGSLIGDDFRFFHGDTNGAFTEGSGFNIEMYNNGLGTDVVFSDLDFNSRYAKLNYVGANLLSGSPFSFGNDVDLVLSPTTDYLRIAEKDYSYTDMFSLQSQIDGSGALIDFTETTHDFVPGLFNRTVPLSGYVEYSTSGNNYNVEDIYTVDASGNLSAEDFFLINAIPYYADTEAVNTTVSKGVQVEVSEFTTDNRAKLYIPHNDNSGYPERALYKLMYYNVRYGTQLAYQGVPAKIDVCVDSKKVCSMRSQSIKGMSLCSVGDIEDLELTQDISQTTAVSNDDVLSLKFREAKDHKAYAISVTDSSDISLLTENVDYTVNIHTKKVVISSDFETTYDNHYVAFEYEYPIFKYNLGKASPMKYFNFISSNYEEEKIQLSGIRIYPEQFFKSYAVNDENSVYTFNVNPLTADITNQMNASIVRLLDGGYRRDTFSPRSRVNMKVSFPKITEAMRIMLLSAYENGEVLGLVTDLLDFKEVFIEPNSFNLTRRKTTKTEQEATTSSYNCNFTIQER